MNWIRFAQLAYDTCVIVSSAHEERLRIRLEVRCGGFKAKGDGGHAAM